MLLIHNCDDNVQFWAGGGTEEDNWCCCLYWMQLQDSAGNPVNFLIITTKHKTLITKKKEVKYESFFWTPLENWDEKRIKISPLDYYQPSRDIIVHINCVLERPYLHTYINMCPRNQILYFLLKRSLQKAIWVYLPPTLVMIQIVVLVLLMINQAS